MKVLAELLVLRILVSVKKYCQVVELSQPWSVKGISISESSSLPRIKCGRTALRTARARTEVNMITSISTDLLPHRSHDLFFNLFDFPTISHSPSTVILATHLNNQHYHIFSSSTHVLETTDSTLRNELLSASTVTQHTHLNIIGTERSSKNGNLLNSPA